MPPFWKTTDPAGHAGGVAPIERSRAESPGRCPIPALPGSAQWETVVIALRPGSFSPTVRACAQAAERRPRDRRMGIDDISPIVSADHTQRKPFSRRELIPVSMAAWREGHDAIGVTLHIDGSAATGATTSRCARRSNPTSSTAPSLPDAPGFWSFRIDAWSDPYTTWRSGGSSEGRRRAGRGRSGQRSGDRCRGADPRTDLVPEDSRATLTEAISALRSPRRRIENRVAPASAPRWPSC